MAALGAASEKKTTLGANERKLLEPFAGVRMTEADKQRIKQNPDPLANSVWARSSKPCSHVSCQILSKCACVFCVSEDPVAKKWRVNGNPRALRRSKHLALNSLICEFAWAISLRMPAQDVHTRIREIPSSILEECTE